MNFSIILTDFMTKRNKKVVELANYVGINRSNMYKIMKGERPLSRRELIPKIAMFLQLNPEETDRLYEAYEIDTVGEFVYYRRAHVKNFLTQTAYISSDSAISLDTASVHVDYDEQIDPKVYYGEHTVNGIIEHIMLLEAKEEYPKITIMEQPDQEFMTHILKFVGRLHDKIELRHLFCIDNSNFITSQNNLYNLECLTNIFPLLLSHFQYMPYYYYNNISANKNTFNMFPNVILTSKVVLTYSTDHQHAILYTNKDIISLYEIRLENYISQSQALIQPIDYFRYCELYIRECDDQQSLIFTTPCPTYVLNTDETYFVDKYLVETFHNKQGFIEFYRQFIASCHETFNNQNRNLSVYYTLQGLDYFTKNGFIHDIPPSLMKPVDIDDRIFLLRRWKEFSKRYDSLYLLDMPEYPPSSTLSFIFSVQYVIILIVNDDKSLLSLKIVEPSLVNAFYDYFSNMVDIRLIDKQQTLKHIDQSIQWLLQQKEQNETK